ncbi:MAG: cyclic-di-AMP receptor [Anaerolineales bacterium]|nr:cyclic-di-AMP receptor [Anaerolineales bacterium]
MKMIIVIIKDNDAENVTRALTNGEFRVTRIASTGGFLRRGVVTLLIGVNDERVEAAIDVVRETTSSPDETEKRATVFVVPVAKFIQV